jgi:hypothetical protein
MTKDEALKLALEALEIVKNHFSQNRHVNEAITAIKKARSAPVQEPVAWAKFLHYPECWDTAAYPTLHDAVHEALAWAGCSVCAPPAAPVQPAAWESEMRSELAKLGFEGQCPESIGITIKSWFDAYAKSLTAQPAPVQPVKNICTECANSDSWGLPDKKVCRSCISNSEWEPLNVSSKNPMTPPAQLAPEQQAYRTSDAYTIGFKDGQAARVQEPSQWRDMVVVSLVREGVNKHKARELADHFANLPAAQCKPLTDEQISKIRKELSDRGQEFDNINDFARAIEAAHGIKEKT